MKKLYQKIAFLLLIINFSIPLHALEYTYITSNNATVGTALTTQDAMYPSYGSSGWINDFKNLKIRNRISVKWDRDNTPFIPLYAGQISVDLNIEYEDLSGSSKVHHGPFTITLLLSNDTSRFAIDKDLSSKLFYGAVWVKVTIINIKDAGGNPIVPGTPPASGNSNQIPKMLIENVMEVNRIYSQSTATLVTSSPSPHYLNEYVSVQLTDPNASAWFDNITIGWPQMDKAEGYEIEYLFVPEGSKVAGYSNFNTIAFNAFNAYSYSFRFNATRIRVSEVNELKIPNIYTNGYLLVRMRLIGKDFTDPTQEIYSGWTLPESGTFDLTLPPATLPFGNGNLEIPFFQEDINWSVSTTFAEEGKHKSQVTYYDGTLRPRQAVVKNNTLNYCIVSQSIFDHAGRESVSIPPAPTGDNQGYSFRPEFNKSSISGNTFGYTDFDENSLVTGYEKEITVLPLDQSKGTAAYYGSGNATIINDIAGLNPLTFSAFEQVMHGYVPNANGYVFAQTEYMNDGTGRVRRQASPGAEHQLSAMDNSGNFKGRHEISYGYETPTQFELDMLFGNEVGYATHYKKVTTKDPNGQNTVSYYDLKGRIIATALEGDATNSGSMLGLPSNGHQVTSAEIISNQTEDYSRGKRVAWKSFYISQPTLVNISYELTPEKFTLTECPDLCFDCKYNMQISLKDANNKEWFPNPNWISVGSPENELNSICEENTYTFTLSPNPVQINLPAGQYTLYKNLEVDLNILAQYKEMLANDPNCLKTLEDHMTGTVEAVCEDCEIGCDNCNEALAEIAAQIATTADYCENNQIDPLGYEPLKELKRQEAELQEKCNGLCQPKTPCQALYEMILNDVSPEGQYSKTVAFDANGAPINGAVSNSLLNDQNGKKCSAAKWDANNNVLWSFTDVDINWRNPIDHGDISSTTCRNYKNEDGSISLIMAINGMPEIKTGASYVTITGDPNQYIKPQDLKYVEDFIRNWQPSWAKSMAIFHPEFCYYLKCDAIKETYEYDLKLYAEPAGSEARIKGYYNPLGLTSSLGDIFGNSILYSEGTSPERDVLMMAGGPMCCLPISGSPIPTFEDFLTDLDVKSIVNGNCSTENDVTIWELFERHKVSLGLNPVSDECASEVVWPVLRGLYLMQKQKYLNLYYYQQNCNSSACGDKNCALAMEQPRWLIDVYPNLFSNSAFASYIPNNYKFSGIRGATTPLSANDIKTLDLCSLINDATLTAGMESDMSSQCSEKCKGVAETWLDFLKDCPALQTYISIQSQKEALLNDLVSVCTGGCDADNPYGSINVNPENVNSYAYDNIDDVFAAHLGANWQILGICDPMLIEFPYKYGHDYVADDDPKRDECACEENKYPGIDKEHCEFEAGITQQGCACEKSALLGELKATYDGTIDEKKCENCIICDDLQDVAASFLDRYGNDYTGNGPYLTDPFLYQRLLTTWFNREYGFNLTYEDYEEFAKNCMVAFTPTTWINLWETVAINRKITYINVPEPIIIPLKFRDKTFENQLEFKPANNSKYDAYYIASTENNIYAPAFNTLALPPPPSPDAEKIACHCQKVLALNKLIEDGLNNGMQGDLLYQTVYGASWSSVFLTNSFNDVTLKCCKLLNLESTTAPPPCTATGFEYGSKFSETVKDHIDDELALNPGDPVLSVLKDKPCTSDNNNGDKGFLDKCACKKIKELQDLYANSGSPLSFEAWVFQQEGVSGSDLTQMSLHCKEMWETGADKDNTGQIIGTYTSNVTWDEVGEVNLNNYAFQKDWKVPKKFKCTTSCNDCDPSHMGDDFGNYVPPCMTYLNCSNFKNYLKSFILANPNLFPEPIDPADLNTELGLNEVTRRIIDKYNKIVDGRSFNSDPANQPYIDFFNALGTYLDNELNNCDPHITRNIHFFFRDMADIYKCLFELNAVKKSAPCSTCYAENREFLNDFMEFLNHVTQHDDPKYLYQTKWYIKHNPPTGIKDFPEFYANSGLYNGTSPSTLRYYIQPGYNNTYLKVTITDNAGYNMKFELNFPGYKPYWNFGEIIEFTEIKIPPITNCLKGDLFVIKAKVRILQKFWNNTNYPELADCPNNQLGTECFKFIDLTGRLYTQDLYTQVPCLGCGKLCNRNIFKGIAAIPDGCGDAELEWGMDGAMGDFSRETEQAFREFEERYISKCMKAAEALQTGRELKLHHFMLYYYDQAGLLIKTVPPEGIDLDRIGLTNTDRQTDALDRHNKAELHRLNPINDRAIPDHWLITQSKYNTLGQPVWSNTPDGGESQVWYDDLGRSAISQNSKQAAGTTQRYSYSRYDNLGRPFEGGELNTFNLGTSEGIDELWDGFDCTEIIGTAGITGYGVYSGSRFWKSTTSNTSQINIISEALKLSYLTGSNIANPNKLEMAYLTSKPGAMSLNFNIQSIATGAYINYEVQEKQSGGWVTLYTSGSITSAGLQVAGFTTSERELKLILELHSGSASVPDVTLDGFGTIRSTNNFEPHVQLLANASVFQSRVANAGKQEVSLTLYDKEAEITGLLAVMGTQSNLRKRVSSAFYFETLPLGITDAEQILINMSATNPVVGYQHATHYAYDIHGNVHTLVQDIPELGVHFDRQFFSIRYKYDLLSGKTCEVHYMQPLDPNVAPPVDAFYHRYLYDNDNRLTIVQTSRDYWHWEKDAQYYYYLHGPLMRMELGEQKVQGVDYAHTTEGWIKAVNGANLSPLYDMGRDGDYMLAGNTHNKVARDAFGYSLSYYSGDYQPVNSSLSNPEPNMVSGSPIAQNLFNLYNGNIRAMQTCLPDINQYGLPARNVQAHTMGYVYRYDQLNRLREFKTFDNLNYTSNQWGTGAQSGQHRYYGSYEYDAMGNITKSKRIANQTYLPPGGTPIGVMDDLTYNYNYSGYKLQNNKLPFAQDAVSTPYAADLENQSPGNYSYDELGNLIQDVNEEIDVIDWNAGGKINYVKRLGTSSKSDMALKYGVGNKRLCKISKPHENTVPAPGTPVYQLSDERKWIYTWYITDAQGNNLATYSQNFTEIENAPNATLNLQELYIYGTKRLGYVEDNVVISYKILGTPGYNVDKSFDEQTWNGGGMAAVTSSYIQMNIDKWDNSSQSFVPFAGLKRGQKRYELTNHLGNVLVVLTDRKLAYDVTGDYNWEYFQSYIRAIQDYEPFGSELPGRSLTFTSYKYGFNNQEQDREFGEYYSFEYRVNDVRLGRFLSVDPLEGEYPWNSTYAFAENDIIRCVDLEGAEKLYSFEFWSMDNPLSNYIFNKNSEYSEKPVLTFGLHNIKLGHIDDWEYNNSLIVPFIHNSFGSLWNSAATTWNQGMQGRTLSHMNQENLQSFNDFLEEGFGPNYEKVWSDPNTWENLGGLALGLGIKKLSTVNFKVPSKPSINSRFQFSTNSTSQSFPLKVNPSMTSIQKAKIRGQLASQYGQPVSNMNLLSQVFENTLSKGRIIKMYCYLDKNNNPILGNYATFPNVDPQTLGIPLEGRHLVYIKLNETVTFLQSTTSNVKDWTGPNRMLRGGGIQLYYNKPFKYQIINGPTKVTTPTGISH